jgi:hypothetical protein
MLRAALILAAATGIFVSGSLLGVWSEKKQRFPASWISQGVNAFRNWKGDSGVRVETAGQKHSSTNLAIPLRYLSKAAADRLPAAIPTESIQVPASQTALILIDTWNSFDPEPGHEPDPYMERLKAGLEWARSQGIAIIHAPNFPAVQKHAAFHSLQAELARYLERENLKPFRLDPPAGAHFEWPMPGHDLQRQADEIRRRARAVRKLAPLPEGACGYVTRPIPPKERDISRFLTPMPGEYVVQSYEELRYVLWKEKTLVLMFGGGALNGCVLQRETGINRLAGVDSQRQGLVIILLEDLLHSATLAPFTEAQINDVMLDYLAWNTVHISSIDEIRHASKP